MNVIVTCGPSYEPIDEVRRITNFSTGELGVRLSNHLAATGFAVLCFKGAAATCPDPLIGCEHRSFTTNQDLLGQLSSLDQRQKVVAVFHAAALADFKVKGVTDERGRSFDSPKISSQSKSLTIQLEPAARVIGELRGLFPAAQIVGWKYELAGAREDAVAKAWQQIREHRTDACVVNGRAYGRGLGLCVPPDSLRELADKHALVKCLTAWLQERLGAVSVQAPRARLKD